MLILNSGFNILQAKILLKLVNDEINIAEFLAEISKPEKPQGFKIITLGELSKNMDAYLHEVAHICAWAKHGIAVEVIQEINKTQYATGTQNLKEVSENYSKISLIDILKDAYSAPYKEGIRRKVFGDLLAYEVLCGKVNTQILNESEDAIKNLLRQRYSDLED